MAKIACIVVLCMVVLIAPQAQALIPTCLAVNAQIAVCVPYLKNLGPLGDCCSRITSLNLAVITTDDRQKVCKCLKLDANIIVGIDWLKAAALPTECKVNIPYLISPELDCATVQ